MSCEQAVFKANLDYAEDYYRRMIVVCEQEYSGWMERCKAAALNIVLDIRFDATKEVYKSCSDVYRINAFGERIKLTRYLPESDAEYRTAQFEAYYQEIPEDIRKEKITRSVETLDELYIRILMNERYYLSAKSLKQEFVLSNVAGQDAQAIYDQIVAQYHQYVPDVEIIRIVPTGHWKTVRDQNDTILYKQFYAFPLIKVRFDFKPYECYNPSKCNISDEDTILGLKYEFEVRSDYANGVYGAPYVVPFTNDVVDLIPHLFSINVYNKYSIRSIEAEQEILQTTSAKDAKPDGYVIDIPNNPSEPQSGSVKTGKPKIMATEKELLQEQRLNSRYNAVLRKINMYENAIEHRETYSCRSLMDYNAQIICEREDRQNREELQLLVQKRDALRLEFEHIEATYDFTEIN